MSKLDLSKLANLKPAPGGGHTAACPACREIGQDKDGTHLRIWRDNSFTCIIAKSDRSHNATILKLAGSGEGGTSSDSTMAVEVAEPQIEVARTWEPAVLDRLVKDHSYWRGRGISDETVAPFLGGVAMDGQMKGRYVFPIFGQPPQEDVIIGFTGRALSKDTQLRWKHLNATKQWIWGGLDDIAPGGRVILVESIGDSLALREHGVPETLCLFGVNLSQAVLGHLITLNPSSIIVSTNRDLNHDVGQQAAAKIRNLLDTFFNRDIVEVKLPPSGTKDWGCATKEQIQSTFNP